MISINIVVKYPSKNPAAQNIVKITNAKKMYKIKKFFSRGVFLSATEAFTAEKSIPSLPEKRNKSFRLHCTEAFI